MTSSQTGHGRSAARAADGVHSFGAGRRLRPQAKVLPEQARAHNRALVLQTLYHRGALSRADLARETGLTRVTISDLVAECIADGIVIEIGVREAAGPGKPAILVDIDRTGHQIIGVDLSGVASFEGAVLDLGGRVIERRSIPLPAGDPDAACEEVLQLIRMLLEATTRPVLGIGIGTPGVVRSDGFVLNAPNLGWQDFPFGSRLRDGLQLPVLVSNDANAAVLAEFTFGEAPSDLMLIRIGRGVGAGLITGGEPLAGGRFAAGEIGHVVVGTDAGPACACGRRGCLEAWVNQPRLERAIADPSAEGAAGLRQAGERLGIGIAPIVAALDLSEVVLAGDAATLSGAFVDAATQALHERTLEGVFADVRIRISAQQDIVLRGAAVMVLAAQLGVS